MERNDCRSAAFQNRTDGMETGHYPVVETPLNAKHGAAMRKLFWQESLLPTNPDGHRDAERWHRNMPAG